ncbi:hypothetical protein C8E97_3078 [Saccharothrix australiensis]|uniref:Uncharacterized protein n=1 Tax=Saccharothrix australiensis TaxID=2072 RepID=A0A495VYQ0_9PSEU|nr:hypothetical protein C8E97_3078 [Saccharothrix australiensis]
MTVPARTVLLTGPRSLCALAGYPRSADPPDADIRHATTTRRNAVTAVATPIGSVERTVATGTVHFGLPAQAEES